MTRLPYGERAALCTHPLTKELFGLMEEKQTNLGLVADVTDSETLLRLTDQIGPHICVLKTHIDIVDDFSKEVVEQLCGLAKKHRFLVFEDRKFADIGNTVVHQYTGGTFRIAEWADIVNAHTLPGPGIIEALRQEGLKRNRGLLLLAQMSSKDNLLTEAYTKKTVAMAQPYSDFVIGYICQEQIDNNPCMLHMTPGVNLSSAGDALGQQYNGPDRVIGERGSDIILVGRGIIKADDPLSEAIRYREAGWQAYETALKTAVKA